MYTPILELNTKKDLEIYMSPVRQQLLRALAVAAAPLTPKALSLRLGISPSSVQHHLGKLLSLGVVKVDHTERINGITATFYVPTNVTVRLGSGRSDCRNEREALAFQVIQTAVQGYFDALHRAGSGWTAASGDAATGVVYLTAEDWEELRTYFHVFMERHKDPLPGTTPWELALVAYDAEEPS